MNIRFDFVFSYWILLWYLLYECKRIIYNPKFALVVGLFENFVYLFGMIIYRNSIINIGLFIIVNFFIKILPLYTLRGTRVRKSDIVFTVVLFFSYVLWLTVNGVDIYHYIKDPFEIFRNNETDKMPLIRVIKYYTEN